MIQQMITGIIRHVITTAGGALVAGGYIGQDELNLAVGAVITLIGVAWSAWDKKRQSDRLPWRQGM